MPKEKKDATSTMEEDEPNPEVLQEKIKLLRKWLDTQNHLPKIKDAMLILFLHSCYYDVDRTKPCIETYYTMRTNMPEIFTDRDVTKPELAKALQVLKIAMFPMTDHNGYRILYVGYRDPDATNFSFVDSNKLLYMTTDAYLVRTGIESGAVLLHDMEGASLRHLFKVSLSLLKKLVHYQQEGYPIRLKAIHIINVFPWIEKAMALIRPLMKSELLEMIHFHNSSIESLYPHIPIKYLPREMGGDQPTIEEMHEENAKILLDMRDYFMEEENLRVDESLREKKKTMKTTIEHVHTKQNDVDDLF